MKNNIKTYENLPVIHVVGNTLLEQSHMLISEYSLSLFIDNSLYKTLLITPDNMDILVYGFLFNEQIIDAISDVKDIIFSKNQCHVSLYSNKSIRNHFLSGNSDLSSKNVSSIKVNKHKELDASFHISTQNIYDISQYFKEQSGLYRKTRSVHSVVLKIDEQRLYFEDIDCDNALDKACGYMIKHHMNSINRFIFTNGRISNKMLQKCIFSKIPIIISREGATSSAYQLANSSGITMIGFVQDQTMNIYTHQQRILQS